MKKQNYGARLSLIFTYICVVLLAVAIIALPFLVTWYTETMGRSASLATTIMLTCYPCAPLAAIALLSLRLVLKAIVSGDPFSGKNYIRMRRVSVCCLIAALIMLFAGNFYMPFYIAGGASIFCALLSKVFTDIMKFAEEKFNEEKN